MKNPTFSRFTHCKSVFSFALNNFISAFFACIFFIYTRFENTHEAIVDAETWKLAQQIRKTVKRTDTTGEANPLTGLLYCADCGAKMYDHRGRAQAKKENRGRDPVSGLFPYDHYDCSTYALTFRHYKQECFEHYISTRDVWAVLLDTIKTVSIYAISNEAEFIEKVRAASEVRQAQAAKDLKRKLNRDRSVLDSVYTSLT